MKNLGEKALSVVVGFCVDPAIYHLVETSTWNFILRNISHPIHDSIHFHYDVSDMLEKEFHYDITSDILE